MPGGDRTGPLGLGPMTGRAAGYCAGFAAPGYAHPVPTLGWGRGRGGGRGRGRWPFLGAWANWPVPWLMRDLGAPAYMPHPYTGVLPWSLVMTSDEELSVLNNQVRYVESVLKTLRSRIEELTPKASDR